MGILDRLSTLIKSNVNDAIDSMQDPGKEIDQMVRDMEDYARQARAEVARCIADERLLERRQQAIEAEIADWQKKAEMSIRAGDDALAKEALVRQKEHEDLQTQFEQQWHLQKDAVEKLKDQLRTLNNKIEEAKRKKNILVARAKRAEAQKTIQATMAGLSDTSAFETFDRMAEKVEQAEAEAEAGVELAGEMTGDTLQSRFKQLENTGGADMALQELKAKMGLGPATTAPRKELPASKEGEGGAAKPKEAAGGGSKDE